MPALHRISAFGIQPSFGPRISAFGFLPLACVAALPPARRIARHWADCRIESSLVCAHLSERGGGRTGVCDSIPGRGLELPGSCLADGGPRLDRRSPIGRREPLADAALRAVAADRTASRRRGVCRLSALPLDRRADDPRRAARRRNPGIARVQPPALRTQ